MNVKINVRYLKDRFEKDEKDDHSGVAEDKEPANEEPVQESEDPCTTPAESGWNCFVKDCRLIALWLRNKLLNSVVPQKFEVLF